MNEALKPDDVAERSTPAPHEVTQRVAPAPAETAPRRRRRGFAWIAIVAVLAGAGAYAWQRFQHHAAPTNREESSGRPAHPPQTVRVAPVTLGDMPLTIDALGTVTPFETVTIRTQIAGTLQSVGFTEGQTVKAGDFIAQIDPRPYEAALAQAQGQLAKDQALLGQAQGDLARFQQLAKQDSIAMQQVADQIALVAQDKAAIAADQAMVKTAELNVAYAHIVSPVTGRVGLRLVDPGNYLQPSDASGIVVITQIDPISVVFTTPEDNLPRISARLKSGAKLPVTVLDRDNVHALATGTLTTYDSQIDVTTGTIRMRATFANPDGVLFPNQFVNVRLLVDTMTGATLAPNAAIQLGASGNFVYLLTDNSTVAKRDVTLGPADSKDTVVASGLKRGDKVVIDGVDRLRDGASVKVVDNPPGAAQAPDRGANKPGRLGRRAARASIIAIATASPEPPRARRLRERLLRPPRRPMRPPQGAPPSSANARAPRRPARRLRARRNDDAASPARRRLVNPSRIFIDRPVATSLLMIAILLIGVLAFRFLPLSALPEVDYPTIQVQTFYPGASPEVMTSAVTAPLERQFGQMPSLSQMMSQSSAGASVITLRFGLDIGLDIAEQEVQAAINAAGNLLPADLPAPPIYAKVNPADAPILTLGVASDSMKLTDVEDIIETRLVPKLSQLPGVGLVSISGGQRPAVRIHVNPLALSGVGLNLDDLRTTIANLNVNTPKGNFDGPAQASAINANDQIRDPNDYAKSIIAYRNGAPVRLSDVARVEIAPENDRLKAWMNTTPALIVNIQRQPGANVIQVVDSVKRLLPSLRKSLPAAITVKPLTDRTTTIRASVEDVEFELALAVGLVVMVIFIFLRNIPATIIPSLSVPLSLIGALAIMYEAGFSLDNLSLMALTVATGFVVDDAIVVIENIARFLEQGDTPHDAAMKGSAQIGFTIISLTVSLIAVLIPLLFMGDVVGRLFHEFAITLAAAIVISAVVSLTLVPMLCAKLLRPGAMAARRAAAGSSRRSPVSTPRRCASRSIIRAWCC